ncbi:hypothetical protein J31TS4_18370 [Paenibacillus sp. J31TS4]|uniref:hypothetical protein n=1 Tax=Paenibacillus sp. J31TS4 TaxID=2807195 RepID=UPI001B068810|nr:hypothetical protein [Paenibacillus sp. J31TS4]GIP38557.1 hypothetical protein J31TS4_18370 [Paenibacillus sp. J31TS4]
MTENRIGPSGAPDALELAWEREMPGLKPVISRREFAGLETEALGSRCFEPFIPLIRGRSQEVKNLLYRQLTRGQRSLFLFFAHYNHAKQSPEEFYWWTAHYWTRRDSWEALRSSLVYFEAGGMLDLLDRLGDLLAERSQGQPLETMETTYSDLETDPGLGKAVRQLYASFLEAAPSVLRTIGETIRGNPSEFVALAN